MIERGQGGKMLEIGNVTRALRVLLLTLDNRGTNCPFEEESIIIWNCNIEFVEFIRVNCC